MVYIYILTVIALLVSFQANRNKTLKALKVAFKKLIEITPAFLAMLILVSIILFLVPNKSISQYFGSNSKFIGMVCASVLGSITLMPGFIAFPLSGILLNEGVSYMVLSAFTSTLMMVGIVTFPIEKKYFGVKVAVVRNLLGLLIALIVAVVTGIVFGEIF